MCHSPRAVRFVLACGFAVLAGALVQAHNFVGLLDPVNARARVQSPNANLVDLPIPIPGTTLSVACFNVRNTSPFDSRITAIGIDVPGTATGYTLISPLESSFHLIEDVGNILRCAGG